MRVFCEILCVWNHHSGIITTNSICVVSWSGWIALCVPSEDYTMKKKPVLHLKNQLRLDNNLVCSQLRRTIILYLLGYVLLLLLTAWVLGKEGGMEWLFCLLSLYCVSPLCLLYCVLYVFTVSVSVSILFMSSLNCSVTGTSAYSNTAGATHPTHHLWTISDR